MQTKSWIYQLTALFILTSFVVVNTADSKPAVSTSFELKGADGEYFIPKGKAFDMKKYLKENEGRVVVFYYVDPDKRALSKPLEKEIIAADLPENVLQHLVIINLKAATLPSWLLKTILKKRAKDEIGRSTYVMDKNKVLTKSPHSLPDDNYFVAILSKSREVVFSKTGPWTVPEARNAMEIIRREAAKK